MTITNKMNLPQSLVNAVSTERHNAPGCVSATTLLQGAKQIVLSDRHWDELEDDASDRVWAVFGTAVHRLLEEANPNAFTEERFEWECGSKTVTGQVDLYDMERGEITDYKTASVWKVIYKSFDDWRLQGLIYAFLLRKSGLEVGRCRFVALLKDWSKAEAARSAGYPKSPTFVFEFAVTDELLDGIGDYIVKKVAQIEEAESLPDDEIPECSERERWAKPSSYAVMKEGRKTAVKVCGSKEEAEAIAAGTDKGYVQERKGKSGRCEGYCLCRNFCSFYRENCIREAEYGKGAA